MKKIAMIRCILLLMVSCQFISCSTVQANNTNKDVPEITATSHISESECLICNYIADLPSIYKEIPTVGAISLNDTAIHELNAILYNDDGTLDESYAGQLLIRNMIYDNASIQIVSMPQKLYAEIIIKYDDDVSAIDYDIIVDHLCQNCIDKVLHLENTRSRRERNIPSIVLIDFSTKELYSTSFIHGGMARENYAIKLFHDESELTTEILVFYTVVQNNESDKKSIDLI